MQSKPAAVPADGIVVQKRIEEALRYVRPCVRGGKVRPERKLKRCAGAGCRKEMRADAMKKCDRFVGVRVWLLSSHAGASAAHSALLLLLMVGCRTL